MSCHFKKIDRNYKNLLLLTALVLLALTFPFLLPSANEEMESFKNSLCQEEENFWHNVLTQSAEILKINEDSFEIHKGLIGEYYEARLSKNTIVRITKESYYDENGKIGLSATMYIIDSEKENQGKRNIIKIFQEEGE